jgi:predicted TIM-barrel fold metal-dependent hydrolase
MSDWVSLTHEEPVDPKRPIIDSHHHIWDDGQRTNPVSYSGGNDPAYLPRHLHADMNGHHFIGSVFVQCSIGYYPDGPEHLRPVGETAFVARQAELAMAKGPPILGIVAYADVARTDVLEEVLDAHTTAGKGRFRGIRQMPMNADGTPRALLAEPGFRAGLEVLGRRGLTFDAMLSYTQLAELALLAPHVPETALIIDHIGAPMLRADGPSREEVTAAWRDGIRALVPCPNVVIKLGGIGMERVFGMTWSKQPRPPTSDIVAARWRDEVRFCIDTLGPGRCMFESNFPVDRLAVGYTVLWNAFQKMAAQYSDAEQNELFAGTASRVYGLALSA